MNFTQIEQTLTAAAQDSGLLGTIFWWDLGNNRFDHATLTEHASNAGLPDELLPAPIKAVNAFRRAWRAAARRIDADIPLRQAPNQLLDRHSREIPHPAPAPRRNVTSSA